MECFIYLAIAPSCAIVLRLWRLKFVPHKVLVILRSFKKLWNEYWATLGLAPQFQSFADELRNLPGAYGEAGGRLMIARLVKRPPGRSLSGVYPTCHAK